MDTSALTGVPSTSITTTSSTPAPVTPPPSTSTTPPGSVTTPAPVTPPPSNPPPAPPAATNDDESSVLSSGGDATSEMTSEVMSTNDEPTTPPPPPPPPVETCVDVPDPEQTCATRKEWGNCEQQWLIDADYCALTCGRCTPSTPPVNTNTPDEPTTSEPQQPQQSGPTNDPRFPPVTSGGDGFATRYWDCAKPSCGWKANAGGNAVKSCDRNGSSIGVTDERNGLEGGNAFTCFSWAPWSVDNTLSFGFVATHTNSTCGKCYQLQFTGQGQHNAADPGSVALKDKTMIVMATNIGGDVQGFQLDMLIPGGGVGANNACTNQGVPAPSGDLAYGGFLKKCSGNADLNSRKECVRQECNSNYSDAKFADLKEGCLWFVDWYNAADNPKFWSKEVQCPQEFNGVAR